MVERELMDVDVAIIGGGPAGSAAATLLARAGWRVAVFEKEQFPREHVGESLLPASLPILEDLGVMSAVRAAGFVEKPGATMVWGRSREPWSWYFRETNANPHAFQVWRPKFDQLLLQNAAAHGTVVHEGTRVLAIRWEGERAVGLRVSGPGGERDVITRHVVDASGQAGLIGRELRLRTPDIALRNLAVYGYFRGAKRLPEPDQGNIFVESYTKGWAWAIPLNPDWTSAGVVVDSAYGRAGIRERNAKDFYHQQLAQAARTSEMLAGAEFVKGPEVVRDWSYTSSQLTGPGWVLAGDAAAFIDPLFSSGVHLALSSAVVAAAYVNTVLVDPTLAVPAGEAYTELYRTQYEHFRELVLLFYGSNQSQEGYFWEARRITGAEDVVSPRQAFIRAVAGQSPRGYERAVLGHGDLPESFTSAVDAVEGERRTRRERLTSIDFGGIVASREPGLRVVHKPVLAGDRFEWGYTLERRDHAPTPVSALIAAALLLSDGSRTVDQVASEVAERAGRPDASASAREAMARLYEDGALREHQESPSQHGSAAEATG